MKSGSDSFKILRWAGAVWAEAASGKTGFSSCNDACFDCVAAAYDFAIVGNGFYVCGGFWDVNGICSPDVARWDGTSWSNLGTGLGGLSTQEAVSVASTGSELFVGGVFTVAGGKPSSRIGLWHIPHALSITRLEQVVTLSWPATGTNFILESVQDVAQTNWSAVPQPFSVVNDQCVVTNDISASNRFYRLRRR